MGTIKGKVKCIICKEEIKIEVKINSIDDILIDLEKEFNNNNWTIVNVENEEVVNIICDECIDFVMKDARGAC